MNKKAEPRKKYDFSTCSPACDSFIENRQDFISNISHEMRTPMNAILGFAQMLGTTELSQEQAEYLEVILESGKRLLGLISNMLDLTNLSQGKVHLNPECFNIYDCLERFWAEIEPRILAKNLQAKLIVKEGIPPLRADCEKISRILRYLVSNAIKYTETGEICLRVDLQDSKAGPSLCFEVEDTGIGIEKSHAKQLFEPFEQADTSFTRSYQGLGLGLGLANKLVEIMGGQMGLHSTLGKGSNFYFQVPVELS